MSSGRHRDGPDGMSQQEVADLLGITRSRLGQIENAALRKLRKAALERGLSLADFFPERERP